MSIDDILEKKIIEISNHNDYKLVRVLADSKKTKGGYVFEECEFWVMVVNEFVPERLKKERSKLQWCEHKCSEKELIDRYEHYDKGNMPVITGSINEEMPNGIYIYVG